MDSFWTSQLTRLRRSPPSFLATLRKPSPETVGKLCSTCSKINFSKLFKPSKGQQPPKWRRAFSACAAAANIHCPFCRLLWDQAIFSKDSRGNPKPDSKINVEVDFDKFSITGQLANTYVPYLRIDGTGFMNTTHLFHSPEPGTEGDCTRALFRGRPWTPLVDVKLIQHWLDRCERSHDKCRESNGTGAQDFPHSIRVIDVNKRCVVEIPANCKYVALSYVWGNPEKGQITLQKETTSRLHSPGGLSDSWTDIPSTIADAMKFCWMMGRDYLWVDALCIRQDDKDDRDRQIQQMDKVYALADFTIVQAPGVRHSEFCDSWSGLPGVSKPRFGGPKIEKIRQQQFGSLATGRFLQEIPLAFWSRRAWTMQEMYLSGRLIYFDDPQVYFQCRETVWREDQYLECDKSVRMEDNQYVGFDTDTKLQFIKEGLERTGSNSFQRYCQLITGICTRAMTKPEDILRAFTGIANVFARSMQCQMVWGLPTAFFDYALLFESLSTLQIRRRQGFPTWSWTGWKEPTHGNHFGSLIVYYDGPDDYVFFNEVDWYSSFVDDPNTSTDDDHQKRQYVKIDNNKIPKASGISVLDSIRSSWRPSSPMERSSVPDELTKEEQDMLLIFQTSCGTIDVVYNDCALGGVFDTLLSSDGLRRTINLRRQTAEMSKRRIQRVQDNDIEIRNVEFVVLGTVMLKEDLDKEVSTANAYLKLMAIKTDDRGVSERIGIVNDKVAVRDWLACSPQWRTVFLI